MKIEIKKGKSHQRLSFSSAVIIPHSAVLGRCITFIVSIRTKRVVFALTYLTVPGGFGGGGYTWSGWYALGGAETPVFCAP